MQNLDRLGWAGGVSFVAYGRTIGVRWNVAESPEDVMASLPPQWTPYESQYVEHLLSVRLALPSRPGLREFNLLYAGVRPAARSLRRDEVVVALEQEIQNYLAHQARDRVFVHAGVVGWRDRAVLFPGRSMAGKSTLVAALLAAGATYYSDEFAVLDGKGLVHPYPRRLSLRTPQGARRLTAESLGATTGVDAIRAGMVIRTDFRAGSEWRPQRLTPARALVELASYTLPEITQTPMAQNALSRIAETAPAYRGARGEAAATAHSILNVLESLP
jgi:hypothetical protein